MPPPYDPWAGYRVPTIKPPASERSSAESYYDRLAREAKEREARERQRAAVRKTAPDPDAVGRARRLERELNVPAPVIQEDIKAHEEQKRREDVARAARDPKVGPWMAENADIASDDIATIFGVRDATAKLPPSFSRDRLATLGYDPQAPVRDLTTSEEAAFARIEQDQRVQRAMKRGTVGQVLGSLRAGTAIAGGGLWGFGGNIAGLLGAEDAERFALDVQAATEEYAAEQRGASTGFVRDALYGGIESVPTSISALMTGSMRAGMGLFFTTTSGNSYADARAEGLSVGRSTFYGTTQGAIEVGTEMLPMGRLLDLAKGKGTVGNALKRFLWQEMAGEQAATVLQDLNDWATLNPEKSFNDYLRERPEAIARTALGTISGAGPQAVVAYGLRRAFNVEAKIEASTQSLDGIDELMGTVEGSKARERDPAAFRTLLDSLAEEGHIYVPAETIISYNQDYANDEFWGDYADEIAKAGGIGGTVEISVADLAVRMTPEVWEAIKDVAQPGARGMSREEIAEANAEIEGIRIEEGEQFEREERQARRERGPAERLRESIRTALMHSGMSAEEASTNAEITASLFEKEAADMGRTLTGTEFDDALGVQRVLPELLSQPEAADTLDLVINAMRNGGDPNIGVGPSLLDFIRERGGINDTGGDLAAMGMPRRLIREGGPDQGALPGVSGRGDFGLDTTLRAAIEQGFFPELAMLEEGSGPSELDPQVLLDAIQRELGGQKVYAEEREDQFRIAGSELRRVLLDAGLDPDTATREQIDAAIAEEENISGRLQSGRDGGGGQEGGSAAPLDGAPTNFTGPIREVVAAAEAYAERAGIDLRRQAEYALIDEDRAKRIAQAYEEMEHAPDDPAVREAYADMMEQTRAQYDALVDAGFEFYFFDETNDPYDGNPWNALRDLRDNKRMGVFASEGPDSFGSDAEFDASDHPLLADTGIEWAYGSPDGPTRRVLANDLFRAVHDAFGHGMEGAGFRARGEENAWQAHVRLFTGPAIGALTSETRGQNSWLNFGPHGEANRNAPVEETMFADQKAGLMPEWTWQEGRVPDEAVAAEALPETIEIDGEQKPTRNSEGQQIAATEEGVRNFWAWFGDSKVVDADGRPLVVYHGTGAEFEAFDPEMGAWNYARDEGKFFFTSEEGVAERYSSSEPMGNQGEWEPRIVAAYVAVSNPWTEKASGEPDQFWDELPDYIVGGMVENNDGAIVSSAQSSHQMVVAFEPTQIKSVDNVGSFDPADPRILRQDRRQGFGRRADDPNARAVSGRRTIVENRERTEEEVRGAVVRRAKQERTFYQHVAGFYSALERAVEGIKTARAPAQQWIATLKKAPGVKQEELEWTGIIDWLEAQKGPVEKEDVMRVVEAGGIEVDEVELRVITEDDIDPALVDERLQDEEDEFHDTWEPQYFVNSRAVEDEEGNETGEEEFFVAYSYDGRPVDEDETFADEDEAQERAWELDGEAQAEAYEEWAERRRRQVGEDLLQEAQEYDEYGVQYQSYASDSENPSYRELLITLPPTRRNNPKQPFTGTHFGAHEHEGIIAHTRFMDKKGPNGERILFVEEIQSDWHQRGRDEGYERKASEAEIEAAKAVEMKALDKSRDLRDALRELVDDGTGLPPHGRDLRERGMKVPEGRELIEKIDAADREVTRAQLALNTLEQGGDVEVALAAADNLDAARDELDAAVLRFNEMGEGIRDYTPAETVFFADKDQLVRDVVMRMRGTTHLAAQDRIAASEAWELRRDHDDRQQGMLALDLARAWLRDNMFLAAYQGHDISSVRTAEVEIALRDASIFLGREVEELRQEIEADLAADRAFVEAFGELHAARSKVDLREREYSNVQRGGAVPEAPFKGENAWAALVMKRLIVWAAEGGYDQIAWIKSGENNGGMNDNVGWFYDKMLPNVAGKIIKKHGAKVKPLRVGGMKAAPVPRVREIDDRMQQLMTETAGTARISGDTEEAVKEVWSRALDANRSEAIEHRAQADEYERQAVEAEELIASGTAENALPRGRPQYLRQNAEDRIAQAERIEGMVEKASDWPTMWAAIQEYRELREERAGLMENVATNLGFDITPELKEAASEGFALFQGKREMPQGQISGGIISGTEGRAIIKLFEGANFSTFQHEMAHFWLERTKGNALAAVQGDGNPAARQLFADWETLKAWFAAEGFPVGDDNVIPEGAHELFARSWERYLMEGKAPKPSLKSAFRRFARWLSSIYRTVKNLNAPITPEIRSVMDRMLATEEQIEMARQERDMRLMFDDAVDAGMTVEEARRYAGLGEEARSEAEEELYGKVYRAIRAREQKQWKRQEKAVREEVTRAVEARPLFKALGLLREKGGVRLNRDEIAEVFGEDALALLPAGTPVYSKTGESMDRVAEMAGYRSGDEMVRELISLEETRRQLKASGDDRSVKKATIDQEVAMEMGERFGDPLNDGTIEREAAAAIQNERQGERLELELKALASKTKRRPTPYAMAREWARERIEGGVISDMISGEAQYRYTRTASKASRQAQEAFARGDHEEAYRHKQTEMLHNALAREAAVASERVEKAVKRMGDLAKQRTVKSMAQDYLDRIHGLLEGYEFKRQSQRFIDARDEYARWAQEQTDLGHDVVAVERLAQKKNWSRMTVEEMIALDDAVKQLTHLGRLKQTLLDNKKKREFNEVVYDAVAQTDQLPHKPKRGQFGGEGVWQFIKSGAASVHAMLAKMEEVFDTLDGKNSNGIFNRVVFKPIADAQARERDMLDDIMGRLNQAMKSVPKEALKRWQRRHHIAELIDPRTGKQAVMLGEELLVMALNMGNRGNMEKLIGGFGWDRQYGGMEQARAVVMDVLNRELTVDDWQYVQTVWDTINELWPEIAALEKRVNGLAPEKVEAVAIDTIAGRLSGGYFPVVYDPRSKVGGRNLEVEERGLFPSNYFRSTTRAGSTRERTEFRGPLHLSLGVVNRHVAEVVHDITHREVIMNADKFLSDDRVQAAMENVLGPELVAQMRPWLAHIANEWATDREGNSEAERFLKATRTNATIVGLGFRISTMMLQISGYSNSIEAIGLRHVAGGVRKMLTSKEAWTFALGESKELASRMATMDRDIRDNAKRLASKQKGVLDFVQQFAFHGIGYMDRLVSVGSWHGAYDKAIGQGMDHDQAVFAADKAIRQTQGSGAAKDLARVQRGTGKSGEAWKLLTMFYSFASALYSRQWRLVKDTKQAIRDRDAAFIPEFAGRYLMLIVIPSLLSEWLAGRGPDDDEDPAAWALANIISFHAMPVPFARDIIGGIETGFGYSYTPAAGFGESITRIVKDVGKGVGLMEGEPSDRTTRNFLEAVGYTTGKIPGQVAATTQFLVDVGYGEENPDNLSEWWEGITKGRIED